jgi:hypothetical protein
MAAQPSISHIDNSGLRVITRISANVIAGLIILMLVTFSLFSRGSD